MLYKVKLLKEIILYYVMTKMIEDIQKCLTCSFEAPITEWPILRNGKIKSLCEPCTIKQCTTCTNQYQVKLWKRKEDGELHDRCMCCRFDMVNCSKCFFKEPREEWKTKPDGSLYKLCPGCREMFRTHAKTGTADYYSPNEYQTIRYNTDNEYRLKRLAQAKVRNAPLVKCPDCNKEMNKGSLYAHVKYKRCKGKPVEKIE